MPNRPESETGPDYKLVIEEAEPNYDFRYWVRLFFRGNKIGGHFCSTQLGARIWARRIARKHKRLCDATKPFRKEVRINA